ncbi:hypothetical protein [Paenibacillus silvae]|uniref:Core-binding (CB) domain-containing protein n=1 Tax=Paenibacillus silvae TaxID=1325358 RepID=A0A2W6NNI8_9BACL|nr:hypothetical protein [Paenibacillus silvae]PZT57429.1 hypothetical protein DN757_01885 [Paenibacillus silvae]
MSNKVYNEDFYNEEQKNRYLKDFSAATKSSYSRVFKRAAIMEQNLNKDLYDFNLTEISEFLYMLGATKISSVRHTGSVIKNYIGWAIDQDLRIDNINPLDAVTSFEWYTQFATDNSSTLFSEEDIGNVVDGCLNFQDKAIVQAVFEGIMGRQNSEIINMKMEHIREIDNEYRITLYDNTRNGQEIREIPISNFLYNILRIANREDKHIKFNGILKTNIKSDTNKLMDNDYIIRSILSTKVKQGTEEPASIYLVQSRLTKIAEWNNLPQLTVMNIRNSGMLKMARDLYLKHGKLETEEYAEIFTRYNIKKDKFGQWQCGPMKVEFLNIPTIKSIYNL